MDRRSIKIDAMPDAALAHRLVAEVLGLEPVETRRFPTGTMHYVYEARFTSRAPVVIRLAAPYGAAAMRQAAALSRELRPRGVPLPAILAEDLADPHPWLLLERLPGNDLGHVFDRLIPVQLDDIAAGVVDAQRIVSSLPRPAGRYGFAATPGAAPHASWFSVLAAHLERSGQRIARAGLFHVAELDPLARLLPEVEPETRAIPPTPFLHDTTTKNVIVSPAGALSGIVDVDDLCYGDPRYVVALTAAALVSRGRPLHYVETWLRLAGFLHDRLFQVYVALFLADFMAECGQEFNGNKVPVDAAYTENLRRMYKSAISLV
jgi:aminoglycoside phosphotransferase (APT) family kinase protein